MTLTVCTGEKCTNGRKDAGGWGGWGRTIIVECSGGGVDRNVC